MYLSGMPHRRGTVSSAGAPKLVSDALFSLSFGREVCGRSAPKDIGERSMGDESPGVWDTVCRRWRGEVGETWDS